MTVSSSITITPIRVADLLAIIMLGALTAHLHSTGRPVSHVRRRRVGMAVTFPAS